MVLQNASITLACIQKLVDSKVTKEKIINSGHRETGYLCDHLNNFRSVKLNEFPSFEFLCKYFKFNVNKLNLESSKKESISQ